MSANAPQIFDRRMIRRARQFLADGLAPAGFLLRAAADDINDRIRFADVRAERGVVYGALTPEQCHSVCTQLITADCVPRFAGRGGAGAIYDEDALPFVRASLGLYVSVLTLHAINDLPGALIQIRRVLKPGGLFVGAMLGGESLNQLRQVLAEAEIAVEGGLSPRVAPMVDVKDAGALLQRAGFEKPVSDIDTLEVSYAHPSGLLTDLKAMGERNWLSARRRGPIQRATLARAMAIYQEKFANPDGRISARFDILYLTGYGR